MRVGLILCLVACFFGRPQAGLAKNGLANPASSPQHAPGLIWVRFAPASGLAPARLSDRLQAGLAGSLPQIGAVAFKVQSGMEQAALQQALADPAVLAAEVDYPARGEGSALALPNDPGLAQQWALQKTGMPFAWDITHGSPDVVVAVLDSGVQMTHPDLAGQVWVNSAEIAGNGLDDDQDGKVDDVHGWHFYHLCSSTGCAALENALIDDDNGHGTLTAGIIAAKSDNAIGISGIASDSKILPVKVLDQYGNGWYSDIAAGILYAADRGAKIINLSLGGEADSSLLRAAVDYARGKGALLVAAAGNCGNTGKNCIPGVNYPAAYDPVVAVAASDANDRWAPFSDYGPAVDLAAPGTDIYGTWNYSNYLTRSGTSFAAPQVAGLAALLWAYRPELTLAQVEALLFETAQDIGAAGKDPYTGWGRISANHLFGRLANMADLWVECQPPPAARAGDPVQFTLRYGNRGYSPIDAWQMSATLTPGQDPPQTLTWTTGALAAGSAPLTLQQDAAAPPPGIPLALDVQVSTLAPEFDATNNRVRCTLTTPWQAYIPGIVISSVVPYPVGNRYLPSPPAPLPERERGVTSTQFLEPARGLQKLQKKVLPSPGWGGVGGGGFDSPTASVP